MTAHEALAVKLPEPQEKKEIPVAANQGEKSLTFFQYVRPADERNNFFRAPRGGITFHVIIQFPDVLLVSYAICRENENFRKAEGMSFAMQRMDDEDYITIGNYDPSMYVIENIIIALAKHLGRPHPMVTANTQQVTPYIMEGRIEKGTALWEERTLLLHRLIEYYHLRTPRINPRRRKAKKKNQVLNSTVQLHLVCQGCTREIIRNVPIIPTSDFMVKCEICDHESTLDTIKLA